VESRSISIQEIRVFQALSAHTGEWLTNREIAEEAAVAERTARAHTAHFVELGIAAVTELFPAHRYRLKDRAAVSDTSYLERLEQAVEVLSGLADKTAKPR
jgi:DNA-binding IclR family transcriptional regulator